MDDIAKILGISKKTIYQVFRDKEALFLETVDYLFDRIKDSEQKIVENQEMDGTKDSHNPWCDAGMLSGCGPQQFISVKEKNINLSSGGSTARNRLGNDHCPVGTGHAGRYDAWWDSILKMMLEASLEQFFQRDILLQNEITYAQALQEVVGILMYGIASER